MSSCATKIQGRTLHWVFKIGDRTKTMDFYRNVLGMKILRHEEFKEGCEASCNGPYDGHWSKTMVGYGPEDNHFVVELTYNYGIGKYQLGNDFQGISIASKVALENAKKSGMDLEKFGEGFKIKAPDGYPFILLDSESSKADPVQKVSLSCTDLAASTKYWVDLLGMELVTPKDNENKSILLQYGPTHAQLELVKVDKIDRGTAYGRIAFSVPTNSLEEIEARVKTSGGEIVKPFVKLDTPGKATVCVVILADPDKTEICFVGDEAFRELSQVDPEAEKLLDAAMAEDKSSEYFEKKGRSKPEAK